MGRGVAVVPTAPERTRNADSHYEYRWDSAFYYLTGFAEPEAVLVLVAGGKSGSAPRSLLFCRERNEEREIWDGFRYGPDAAREIFGFELASQLHLYQFSAIVAVLGLLALRHVSASPFGQTLFQIGVIIAGLYVRAQNQQIAEKLNTVAMSADDADDPADGPADLVHEECGRQAGVPAGSSPD